MNEMNTGDMKLGQEILEEDFLDSNRKKIEKEREEKNKINLGSMLSELMEDKKKRYVAYGGFSIFALFLVSNTMFSDYKPAERIVSPKESISTNIMSGANYKEMTLEKMTARMEEISNELRKTQRELDASKQESQAKAQKQDNAAVMELTKEVDGLKNSQLATQQNYELKMQMMKDSLEKTVAENMANNATQSQVEQAGKVFEQPKNPFENRISNIAEPGKADAKSPLSRSAGAVAIRDIDEDTSEQAVKDKEKKEEKKDKAKAAEEKKKNEQRKAFLPAGSIMSGTLLTGMFAPTNGYARNDPFPVLMRVKHEALLPNKFTMDVRECFAIGSGYGDLSSERAMIRAEILSCVNDDGVAFEVPLDAYATGPDGKAGMPGKLITRNGQMIAQALMAGFISGMADSMRPRRIQGLMYSSSAYDGAGGFDTPNPESVMSTGAFKGVSTALGRVADYYIQLAEQAFPVIEINAGTKIDFIVKRGVNIRTNK